jgi:hypothetical protein
VAANKGVDTMTKRLLCIALVLVASVALAESILIPPTLEDSLAVRVVTSGAVASTGTGTAARTEAPRAGLACELVSAHPYTVVSGASSWQDQSGNNKHATQSNDSYAPTVTATGAVQFAANQALAVPITVAGGNTDTYTQVFTVVMGVQPSPGPWCLQDSDGSRAVVHWINTGIIVSRTYSSASRWTIAADGFQAQLDTYVCEFAQAGMSVYRNGVLLANDAAGSTTTNAIGTVYIGNYQPGTSYQMGVGNFLVNYRWYSRALTAGEIADSVNWEL